MINTVNSTQLKPLVALSYLEFLLHEKREYLRDTAEHTGQFYRPFDLHKKGTNKWRHIDNPKWALKVIQKRILKNILNKGLYLLPNGMMGGISGKSIVENAKIHINKECIAMIDIKDCFPNTNHLRIYQVWKKYFGCGEKTVHILTKLTTFQDRLPQGAPTSPLLCNFSLASIFTKIKKYTEKNNLDISIFIDDITISGRKKDVINAIQPIISILILNKYAVRRKKVKIITSGYRQKVTGATVNRKLSLGRTEIQQIRNIILETARLKDYIPRSKLNEISGKITFAKQLSDAQGKKLEIFAESLLVKPIIQVLVEEKDERRSCNKYNRSHKFIAQQS